MAFIIDPNSASFSTVLANLEAFQATRPDAAIWNTFFASGVGETVTEQVAALGAFLTYQTIAARRENYLQYAQNTSSLIGISQSLGYSTFRGQNVHLSLTVVPSVTMVLPRYSIIGSVQAADIVVLADTPIVANVPITFDVVIGVLGSEAITAPSGNLFVFRFESQNVSADVRVLLNGTEVTTSSAILDLANNDFVVITNALESVDVSYLNSPSAPVQYNTGDTISIQFSTLSDLTFVESDINFFYGSLTSYSTLSQYQPVESNESIQINAPLYHETQALVRGRLDYLKVFKVINPSFVSTNQTNLTTADVALAYLNDDFSALTPAEKSAQVAQIVGSNLPMGVPPPTIVDPVRVPITLDFQVTLQNTTENTAAEIVSLLAPYSDILGAQFSSTGALSLETIESQVDMLGSVLINRVTIGSVQWTPLTSYERGTYVVPDTRQVLIVTFIADTSGSLAGEYWLLSSPTVNYYVWYQNGSATDPAVAGATGIPVTYTNGATAVVIAQLTQAALSALSSVFSVPSTLTSSITVTNLIPGPALSDPATGTSGFSISVTAPAPSTYIYEMSQLLYFTSGVEPIWTNVIGNTVNDGGLIWTCQLIDPTNLTTTTWQPGTSYDQGTTVVPTVPLGRQFQATGTINESAGVDAVQLIIFNQIPASGTWRLEQGSAQTLDMPYDATASQVQTYLQGMPCLIAGAMVEGDYLHGFTVTFTGTNGNVNQPLLSVSDPGTDEEQLVSFNSVPDSGSFGLTVSTITTVDQASNPAQATLYLTSTFGMTHGVQLLVNSGGVTQETVTVDTVSAQYIIATTNFTYAHDVDETAEISYTTAPIQHTAVNTDVQNALQLLPNVDPLTMVTGDFTNGFTVLFQGNNGLQPVPQMVLSDLSSNGQSEIQTITFSPSSWTGGTWRLAFGTGQTIDMADDASNTIIQTQVNSLPGLSGVVVTGSYSAGLTFTFGGASGLQPQPLLVVNNPGQDSIQQIQFSLPPDFGTWRLDYNGNKTSFLQFNASSSDIEAALNALTYSTTVSVASLVSVTTLNLTSTAGIDAGFQLLIDTSPFQETATVLSVGVSSVTLAAPLMYAHLAQVIVIPLCTVVNAVSNQDTDVLYLANTSLLAAGQQLIIDPTGPYQETVTISSVSPSSVTLMENLTYTHTSDPISAGWTLVTGDYATGLFVEFIGADGLMPQYPLSCNAPGEDEVQLITFAPTTANRGTFTLTFESYTTVPIPYTATANDVQTALLGLVPLDDVTVAGNFMAGYTVTFSGSNAHSFVPDLVVDTSSLFDDTAAAEWLVDCVKDVAGSLNLRTFYLYDDVGSVAFYIDLNNAGQSPTIPALAANRYVRVSTILTNDPAVSVAAKIRAAIGADSQFTAATPPATTVNANSSGTTLYLASTSGLVAGDMLDIDMVSSTLVVSTTATLTVNSDQITVASPTSIAIGQQVTGSGIPTGTTVNAITGSVVTLSGNASTTASSVAVSFYTVYGARFETVTVQTVNVGSVILTTAMTYAHTALEADSVQVRTVLVTAVSPGARAAPEDINTGFTFSTYMGMNGVTLDVSSTVTVTFEGQPPDNQLVKTDNPIVVTVNSEYQEGFIPANSLVPATTITVTEIQHGSVPVSSLTTASVPVDVTITTTIEGQYPANNLLNSGFAPIVVTTSNVTIAESAEPIWPTSIGDTVYDGDILWLMLASANSPAVWQPGTVYNISDYVSPSAPVLDVATSVPMMAQCIGFIGTSGGTQPSFPGTLDVTVVDNNILWKARLANVDPDMLAYNEYYAIQAVVNLTGPIT